ncbi:flavodoxin-dependent (E)-4-hydroxy-3-methylbut-2-enyl-diphosphate synthase [Candidatus Peregrinibacteria bacterium]|nr:MAG: flavodoxin-dependent (E)-4-hydroxy-3-methylbut-2-enyl-diphosphate synthase [Candidatus Peregrinibacteria bacterium]
MPILRRKTRTCTIGADPARQVLVGSEHPVAIQTMCMGKTEDIEGTIAEIKTVEDKGCDLIRLAMPSFDAVKAIPLIKERTSMPIVADIHFDPRLAIAALDYGADKIRINPGNFFDRSYLEKVITLAKEKKAAIRIGVNAGSLEKDLWKKHGAPTAEALAESALRWVKFVEDLGFGNFVVSIKSERVPVMVEAYQRFAAAGNDVPLHLGVTHAGLLIPGAVKNAIGIGTLLMQGIGDTIRASITDDIVKEVEVCKSILKALGIYGKEPDIIACPTCGRIEVDLPKMVAEVEAALAHLKKPVRVAVMGCVVNSVGEAKESDFAIASGKHAGALYYKGELYKANVPEAELVPELLKLIEEKTK